MQVGTGAAASSSGGQQLVFRSLEKVKFSPPSLTEICLRKVAQDFLAFPPQVLQKELGKTKQLEEIYAILDCGIPLVIAAATINDEFYWKRRVAARDSADSAVSGSTAAMHAKTIDQHGCSWKQYFLETELQTILENFPVDFVQAELDELKAIVHACRP